MKKDEVKKDKDRIDATLRLLISQAGDAGTVVANLKVVERSVPEATGIELLDLLVTSVKRTGELPKHVDFRPLLRAMTVTASGKLVSELLDHDAVLSASASSEETGLATLNRLESVIQSVRGLLARFALLPVKLLAYGPAVALLLVSLLFFAISERRLEFLTSLVRTQLVSEYPAYLIASFGESKGVQPDKLLDSGHLLDAASTRYLLDKSSIAFATVLAAQRVGQEGEPEGPASIIQGLIDVDRDRNKLRREPLGSWDKGIAFFADLTVYESVRSNRQIPVSHSSAIDCLKQAEKLGLWGPNETQRRQQLFGQGLMVYTRLCRETSTIIEERISNEITTYDALSRLRAVAIDARKYGNPGVNRALDQLEEDLHDFDNLAKTNIFLVNLKLIAEKCRNSLLGPA